MRQYIRTERPQSFASVWGLYIKQMKNCDLYGIARQDTSDIEEYAKKENIEKYGF